MLGKYAYIPVLDAMALYELPAMMKPAAARSPAVFAASIAVCAAAARSAGVRLAVESKYALTLVYCCGPEPLLNAVDEHCAAWPQGSLHVERFSATPLAAPTRADGDC